MKLHRWGRSYVWDWTGDRGRTLAIAHQLEDELAQDLAIRPADELHCARTRAKCLVQDLESVYALRLGRDVVTALAIVRFLDIALARDAYYDLGHQTEIKHARDAADDLYQLLEHAERVMRNSYSARPQLSPFAGRTISVAALFLPHESQLRYLEEFHSEFQTMAEDSRWAQWRYVLRILVRCPWHMRRAVLDKKHIPASER